MPKAKSPLFSDTKSAVFELEIIDFVIIVLAFMAMRRMDKLIVCSIKTVLNRTLIIDFCFVR